MPDAAERTGVRLRILDLNTSVVELRATSPTGATTDLERATGGNMKVPGRPSCWVSVFFNGATLPLRAEPGGKPPDFNRDQRVEPGVDRVLPKRVRVPQQFGGANAELWGARLWSRR
jgi:hypothetical protein